MRRWLIRGAVIVVLLGVGLASVQLYANHYVRGEVDKYAREMPPGLEMQVETVWMDLFKRTAHLKGITLRNGLTSRPGPSHVTVNEVVVYGYDTGSPVPHYAHLRMDGLMMPLSLTEPQISAMEEMGVSREQLNNLEMDVEAEYHYDPERKLLSIDRTDLVLRGWMRFTSSIRLGNLDLDAFAPQKDLAANPFALFAAVGQIELVDSEIRLEFADLANRILAEVAQQQRITVEELKTQISEAVRAKLSQDPRVGPELAAAIADFLREPGDVQITVLPDRPLSVMEAMMLATQGDQLAQALNISISKY